MNIIEIINKKKNKEKLNYEEIKEIVGRYMIGDVKDYQMSAFLMAICINGLDNQELFSLVDVMVKSGKTLDLSSINGIKVDKHSTGGIGDKTTLIIGPLVASCGVPFVKMSGRGLGYTGGTIDKLEAIDGFKTNLSNSEFIEQINKINISIISQTEDIVPADKKMYALRDVTSTTDSIPLIAASIMSKKIASGANKIVLDVKYGSGALIHSREKAIELAKLMVEIGKKYNKETIALITNMNNPLGNMIGNGLEVKEALNVLNYKGNKELKELCLVLATYIVSLSKQIDFKEARVEVINNLINGKALNKFYEFVLAQGGDINAINISNNVIELKANSSGYINQIDSLLLGKYVMELGAGRKNKEENIDHGVGIELLKNIGDYVNQGDILLKIYYRYKVDNVDSLYDAYKIENEMKNKEGIIFGVIK